MSEPFQNVFKLRRPCANCPFLRCGAIRLAPGRLEGIIDALVSDDYSTFQCHKTVHNGRTGGDWDDDGNYATSGQESMCAGAMIYLEKLGRPTVGMRIGRVMGMYSPDDLAPHFDAVIEPVNLIRKMKMKSMELTSQGLHITEGVSGSYLYHLSEVGTNARSLCGKQTMNTQIPVATWGFRGHLNEKWCTTCASKGADALRMAGVELVSTGPAKIIKLTDAQKRVMSWLGKGWTSAPGAGTSIHVNGARICNVDTLRALEGMGLVEQRSDGRRKLVGEWQATQAGKAFTHDQNL